MKTLQIFNGRGHEYVDKSGNRVQTEHVYICAWSKADAVRVMHEAGFNRFTSAELNSYYSHGCWGLRMDGITPERGVWAVPFRQYMAKPVRIL